MFRAFLDGLSEDDLRFLLGLPLGLTEYEVKALICLAGGIGSPPKIGRVAGIPRAKTYDVLDNLVMKGLVRRSGGKPITYSLKEDAVEGIILEVERRSASLISTLRRLEGVRRDGLRRVVEAGVRRVLDRLGFREVAALDGGGYIVESPQGFRFMIVFPQEELLSRGFKKIFGLRRDNDVRLVLLLASEGEVAMLREKGLRGVRSIGFGEEEFYEGMLSILSELETLEREFEDRRLKYEGGLRGAQAVLSECTSLLEGVRMFLRERGGNLPSENMDRISGRVKGLQEELLRRDLQMHSLRKIGGVVISDFERYGVTSWDDLREVEGLVENVSNLEERLRETRKVVLALYDEVRAAVDRREKLGFAPLSVQPPDMPEDRYIVGQKRLKRLLEEFVWSSKGLGGLSLGVLLGGHGGGKTLFLRYFTGRINRGDFGSAVAVCNIVSNTFLDMYNALASGLSSLLAGFGDRVNASLWFERQRSFADVMRGFPRSFEALQAQGIMNVYWFIDEFDRLMRFSSEKKNVFLRELQVFIDGYSDLPFTMLFASTPSAFEKLAVEYPEVVSRIPRSHVFSIPPLEFEDVKELVSRSLAKAGGSGRAALLEPDEEALRLLLSMSEGNPREVIQMLNEGLYRASKRGGRLDTGILEGLVGK